MSNTELKISEEWKHLYHTTDDEEDSLSRKSLQAASLAGSLDGYPHLRSVFWRIFFEILSSNVEMWEEEAGKEREMYSQLRAKYLTASDPDKRPRKELHPLAVDNEAEIESKNADLRKLIMQDVERTFPDYNFFRQHFIQECMCDILFIYCKLNPDVSYRQGMHEILAPILFTCHASYFRLSSSPSSSDLKSGTAKGTAIAETEGILPSALFDIKFLEHDAFAIFNRIMINLKPLFEHTTIVGRGQSQHQMDMEPFSTTVSSRSSSMSETPILKRCILIQYRMLKLVDNELFKHLKHLEIEPQLYGIRWLRLLFGREFSFDQLFKLWDILFAFTDKDLSMLNWTSLALLKLNRQSLLQNDYSMVLHRLMKYPSDLDPVEVGKLARDLCEKFGDQLQQLLMNQDTSSTALSPVTLTKTPVSPSRSLGSALSGKSGHQQQQQAGLPSWVKNTPKMFNNLVKKTFVDPMMFGSSSSSGGVSKSGHNIDLMVWEALEDQLRGLEETFGMSCEAIQLILSSSTPSSSLATTANTSTNALATAENGGDVALAPVDDDSSTVSTGAAASTTAGGHKRLEILLKSINLSLRNSMNELSDLIKNNKPAKPMTTHVKEGSWQLVDGVVVVEGDGQLEQQQDTLLSDQATVLPKQPLSIDDLISEVETSDMLATNDVMGVSVGGGRASLSKLSAVDDAAKKKLFDSSESIKVERKKKLRDLLK